MGLLRASDAARVELVFLGLRRGAHTARSIGGRIRERAILMEARSSRRPGSFAASLRTGNRPALEDPRLTRAVASKLHGNGASL